MNQKKIGAILLFTLLALAISATFNTKPIIQDEAYHQFSDQSSIFGIPNFWNVISNLPFFLVGIFGIKQFVKAGCHWIYTLFFMGVSCVAFGSAYYHWAPISSTLLWDRLPMTVAFMSLFSISIKEFISDKLGRQLLLPLMVIGICSILYWKFTGDLRIYAFVQFYPILGIPIILIFYKSSTHKTKAYWLLILAYGVAKVFEHFDTQIHQVIGIISGHTLKHVIAAAGIYIWAVFNKKST